MGVGEGGNIVRLVQIKQIDYGMAKFSYLCGHLRNRVKC